MKKEKKVKRIGNKGFSIVEIIIVMAIIAILTGALAPQMVKYIEKARKTADVQTANTIALAVNSALANEYDSTNQSLSATYTAGAPTAFQKEIKNMLGTRPALKYSKDSLDLDDFYIKVVSNEVYIYAVKATDAVDAAFVPNPDNLLYPTIGDNWK